MCTGHGVTVDTGIAHWSPGKSLRFGSKAAHVNLYKLHGSIDWSMSGNVTGDTVTVPPEIRQGDVNDDAIPWIVVGDREKLATDGPTLDLLRAAESALSKATHLVIVGYSFGDAHVNAVIRNWMLGKDNRTFTVLDLGWPDRAERQDPRQLFASRYGKTQDGSGGALSPRMNAIRAKTKDGLAVALERHPGPAVHPYVTAAAVRTKGGIDLSLTLLGETLTDVNIWPMGDVSQSSLVDSEERRAELAAEPSVRSVTIGSIERFVHGSTRRFYLLPHEGLKNVEFEVTGANLVESVRFPMSAPVRPGRRQSEKAPK
ncbi:hypothetical protein BH11ACT5_BH11ACT5_19940 [soil metagenome]